MSKIKNMVIDQMNEQNERQQTIQYLTDLMATIQNAHFKGRLHDCPLRVHEGNGVGISIDLYNFEGDGKDVCDGLHGVTPDHSAHGVDEKETGWVFNMGYDPDDEQPLYFLFLPDGDEDDHSILPDTLPIAVLRNITAWLEQQMKPTEQQKQESDFARAVSDLQGVSLEALDRLHSAAHDVIAELQGDMRLTEAAAHIPILAHILTTELTAFKAYTVKYNKQNQNKQ